MEARALAALGKSQECDRSLLRAEKLLESETFETSPWISGFDEGSLASEMARCMRDLGRLREAERQARRILMVRDKSHTRSRAFGQLVLIAVLISQGRLEESCHVGGEVIEATESLGSYLVLEQLHSLRNALRPYRSHSGANEFLERLSDTLQARVMLYNWLPNDGLSERVWK